MTQSTTDTNRIADAARLSLAWAFAGSAAGFVLARVSPWNPDLPVALIFAPLAFVSGLIFSGVLALVRRRRAAVSSLLFVGCGAVSGLLLTAAIMVTAAVQGRSAWGEFLLFGPPLTIGSAVCAAVTQVVLRRASRGRPLQ